MGITFKTWVKIFIPMVIALVITAFIIDKYWDKKEEKAKQEFIDMEFRGKVDTLISVSRGVRIEFTDSSSISLGNVGIPLRGQVHKGDSIIKFKGVDGYTIITKDDVGFFIDVYR